MDTQIEIEITILFVFLFICSIQQDVDNKTWHDIPKLTSILGNGGIYE